MADNLRAYLIYRNGLLLSLLAVLLQLLVFIQPLLPTQFQVSPVCEVISDAVLSASPHSDHTFVSKSDDHTHQHHLDHATNTQQSHVANLLLGDGNLAQNTASHHHDLNHHCQYCTVYANVLMLPRIGVPLVLIATQVRMLWFKHYLAYVYFYLQQLFVLPQGRAPPLLA